MYFAAEVDSKKCKGCRLCIFACPEPNAIVFDEKNKKVIIDAKRCKNCMLCVESCPVKAIKSVVLQDS
jgi:Pyruvate/2-oxoacid:ferredoxin oxidoreductase delta subunit